MIRPVNANPLMRVARIVLTVAVAFIPLSLFAQEAPDPVAVLRQETNWLWTMIASFLVFFMQAGFALVEAGFTRSKNTVNILMKNLMDACLGLFGFYLIGFTLMFGLPMLEGFGVGQIKWISQYLYADGKPDAGAFTFFFFQSVFCATAATIVSGAMAERTKFPSYLVYSFLVSAFIYPVFGSLAWGNLFLTDNVSFLANLGFIDFAGSTVVHSIGGWIALAGTIVLGPRLGRYLEDGTIQPIFGHNLTVSTLGVFILWIGWFGFNPGSTLVINGGNFAIIAMTTQFAAAAGAIGAMLTSWLIFKRPDATMILNGVLAGLVAITAGCANLNLEGATLLGFVAGVVVVLAVVFFDAIRVDDPVGAVSVHGVCGALGTLSVGLLADPSHGSGAAGLFYGGGFKLLGVQALGVGLGFLWAFGTGLLLFFLLKITIGLRVTMEEEIEGLDLLEHGNEAYPEQI